MIIPMLCVTIFVILVVWFLLPRVARLMIHTPTAISIFVCLSMVQLMARSEERFSRNAETDLVCRLLLEKKKGFVCLPCASYSDSPLSRPSCALLPSDGAALPL